MVQVWALSNPLLHGCVRACECFHEAFGDEAMQPGGRDTQQQPDPQGGHRRQVHGQVHHQVTLRAAAVLGVCSQARFLLPCLMSCSTDKIVQVSICYIYVYTYRYTYRLFWYASAIHESRYQFSLAKQT